MGHFSLSFQIDTRVIYSYFISGLLYHHRSTRINDFCDFSSPFHPPPPPPPLQLTFFFLRLSLALFSNLRMYVICLGFFSPYIYFYFSMAIFSPSFSLARSSSIYRVFSLSLFSSTTKAHTHSPPPSCATYFSPFLLCRVISGNGAAAMFCLPGAGLLACCSHGVFYV